MRRRRRCEPHRTLTDTFAGIKPSSAPGFIAAQIAGGLAAVGLARFLFPDAPAPDLIVPHDQTEPAPRRPTMPSMEDLPLESKAALRSAAANLHREFEGTFDTETIERFLTSS